MKFVIMAGGTGTKLWPVSRDSKPKQFIKLIGDKTLFQLNLEALLLKYNPKDIFVSINTEYIPFIEEQAPMIPKENYIIEPKLMKGTGPASGYAMLKVSHKYPNEVVMFYVQPVVTREPAEKYIEMIEGIEDLVKKHNKLVTGGRFPDFVDIGSDSLEIGDRVDTVNKLEAYKVKDFVHIIDKRLSYNETQDIYNQRKNLIVHCNHLTWKPESLLNAFKEIRPDWYKILGSCPVNYVKIYN